MQRDYVRRMFTLEHSDYNIVKRLAEKHDLGDNDFSAALSSNGDQDLDE